MSLLIATRRAMLAIGGVTYLLNDSFNDVAAAGAVDGLPATPGPGTRTVTDTDSKLSVGSGVANFAPHSTPALGDPGLWYDAVTRVAGQMLLFKVTSTAGGGKYWYAGFDTDQASYPDRPSIRVIAADLRYRDSGPNVATVDATGAVEYSIAFILRSAGDYLFIKGGTFTSWTLLWVASALSDATIYPAFIDHSAAAVLFDSIRIPDRLFIPPIALYDSFGRANGALGDTETTGPDSQPVTPRTWESGGATWAIAGNEVVNTPGVGGELLTNGDMESGFTAGLADNWSKVGGGAFTEEGVIIHGGSSAQKIVGDAGENGIYQNQANDTDEWYLVDTWTYAVANAIRIQTSNAHTRDTTTTGAWENTIMSGRGATNRPYVRTLAAGQTIYIDDVSCKLLTHNALFTDVDDGETSDYLAEVELDTVVTASGLVLNLDDKDTPANFVVAYHDGKAVQLDKCVAGTYTSVISATTAYSAGAKLVVIKEGTSYSLYYNNAKIGSTSTVSDAGIISNTKLGPFSTNSGNQLDNFAAFYRTHADYETEFGLV